METLAIMGRLIVAGGTNPKVRDAAVRVLRENQVPERNVPAMVEAIFRFWQDTYYVWDPWDAEWLQTVDRTLLEIEQGREALDCDDKVIGLAASLRAVGIPALVKVINGDPRNKELDHVYVVAGDTSSGRWIPLDPIQPGADPGWEPPRYREYLIYDPAERKVVERGQGNPHQPTRTGLRRPGAGGLTEGKSIFGLLLGAGVVLYALKKVAPEGKISELFRR